MNVFFIILLALQITACGKKTATGKAEIIIAGVNTDMTTNSNFIISAVNEKTGEFRRVVMSSNTLELSLPNGAWVFNAYHWDAGHDLDGTFRCAQSSKTLDGTDAGVELVLTVAECANHSVAPFTDGATGASQELALVFCNSDPVLGASCSGIAGSPRSYKIVLPEIELSNVAAPIRGVREITSECLTINNDGGIYQSGKVIPSGTPSAPFPFIVRAFSDTSCTVPVQSVRLPQGLLTPASAVSEAYDYTSSVDKSYLYLVVP